MKQIVGLITSSEEIKYELSTMKEGNVFRFKTVDTHQTAFFVKVDSEFLYCVNAKNLYNTGKKNVKPIKLSRLKSIRVF